LHAFQGEIAALLTAACWTVSALSFEAAGKRIGSLAVNIIRLGIAFAFLSLYGWLTRGHFLPVDADGHNWYWLSLSGLVGFTLGDMAWFRSLVLLGARRTTLMMALAPPFTAVLGWLALGEALTLLDGLGMGLTLLGVMLVVGERRSDENGQARHLPVMGWFLGVVAALGQAGGLVLSKFGMGDYSPFAATQIRVIAGFAGFAVFFTLIRWWPKVLAGLRDAPALRRTTLGAFFGPFVGVSFSLMAVQLTQAGIAATIMSITPILIIPPTILLYKERVSPRAIFGACLAIAGVAVLFLF